MYQFKKNSCFHALYYHLIVKDQTQGPIVGCSTDVEEQNFLGFVALETDFVS